MELSCSGRCRSSLSLFSLQRHRSPPPLLLVCFRPPLLPPPLSRQGGQHLHVSALNQTATDAAPAGDYLFHADVEEDDDDDEDVILPLEQMGMWLHSKPRGFGQGKVYDTAIEEKLLEEMLQSRRAQQANLSRLKRNKKKPPPKKEDIKNKKASQAITGGILVRLANLPKKKNIHRDLKAAFEGVPGIFAVSPAVSGNKKTKDPVCKGFAFVHFTSLEYATRFVQQFSGQSLEFGRIKKQIQCEILNLCPQSSVDLQLTDIPATADAKIGIPTETSCTIGQHDQIDEVDRMELSEARENAQVTNSLEPKVSDNAVQRVESAGHSALYMDQQQKPKLVKKKVAAKRKEEKAPKRGIPVSVKKLKLKEKAMLTGVFSKYGAETTSTAIEDRATL